ncbi:MAG: type VI secretion system baseplate subunit TssK [Polyangiaceae bacterium]|jgi:type VI secretion system protein ImpJ|nr:type VI secretion system baseplate subunit TssK [Polyangiaceae bacterium]
MLRKPVWTEGLFLTQHHFQQLDAYHETLLAERLRAALPYEWGVAELEIDERALASNTLRLTRFAVVLPDGAVVRGGEGQAVAVPHRSFDAEFTAQMPHLDVYLALPDRADGRPGVALEPAAETSARFRREQISAPDQNSGKAEHPVDVARPNLRLLLGDERREGHVAVRVAQLVRQQSGAAVVRDTYVPPCFEIRSSTYLMKGFRAVLTTMASRQRGLATARRQRVAGSVDFDANDAAQFWFLHTLNGALPVFNHLAQQGTVHPQDAYLELARLIGQLGTFVADADPVALPNFNYLDLGGVFEPMFARALSMLNATLAGRYVEIPLQRREDGVFVGQANSPELMRSEFFLAVSGSMPEAQVRDRLPKLIKLASAYRIGPILQSAVNGARVELEYKPPSALPLRPGMTVFRIERTPEFWPDIASTGSFGIYHPFDARSVALSLYAVEPAQPGA